MSVEWDWYFEACGTTRVSACIYSFSFAE